MRSLSVACLLAVLGGGSASGQVPPDPPDGSILQAPLSPDYDVPPRAVHITRPAFPPGVLEQGGNGTVLVEILIDSRGRVTSTRVVKSVPGLDAAALACVKQWRFKPAQKSGKPVSTIAQAAVIFKRDEKKTTKA